MGGYTPGPWFIPTTQGSKGGIAHAGGYVAFTAIPRKVNEDQHDGESWLDMRRRTDPERNAIKAEELANQKLLASAPELLEALIACVTDMETTEDFYGKHPAAQDAIARAKAAISRATGEGE